MLRGRVGRRWKLTNHLQFVINFLELDMGEELDTQIRKCECVCERESDGTQWSAERGKTFFSDQGNVTLLLDRVGRG